MSKQKNKKEVKKGVSKQEDFIDESSDKKSIILILIAIVAVLGLIVGSVFMFKEEKPNEIDEGEKVEIKIPPISDLETEEVKKSSEKLAIATKYIVKYLDYEGNQIGKTQRVLDLEDRVNEKPPRIECKRFREWRLEYDSSKKIYYYIATYVDNVERVPVDEEPYLNNTDEGNENTYKTTITKVEPKNEELIRVVSQLIGEIEEEVITNPTYNVEVSGEVSETDLALVNATEEVLTINEEYEHLIALRFNAPEGITKEDIERMIVEIRASDPTQTLNEDQYHYNGEEVNAEGSPKTGRDLLDSTDEEYENNIFYFNYYQEVDTKTNATVEVYWGNDPDADEEALPEPIEPNDEYIEVYNIDVQSTVTEEESSENEQVEP